MNALIKNNDYKQSFFNLGISVDKINIIISINMCMKPFGLRSGSYLVFNNNQFDIKESRMPKLLCNILYTDS